MKRFLLVPFLLLCFTGCGSQVESLSPGRGVEKEVGPMAKIYPSVGEARMDRHGVWRGMDGERVVWELRYTRGLPTGPYREWNEQGVMIATWPYNWDGEIVGWLRWFDAQGPTYKVELPEGEQIDFDPVGQAQLLKEWAEKQLVTQD